MVTGPLNETELGVTVEVDDSAHHYCYGKHLMGWTTEGQVVHAERVVAADVESFVTKFKKDVLELFDLDFRPKLMNKDVAQDVDESPRRRFRRAEILWLSTPAFFPSRETNRGAVGEALRMR